MQIDKSKLYQNILFIVFWIRGTLGFASDELLPFLGSTLPYSYLLFDIVIVALGCLTIRKKIDVLILASFILISFIITCLYNGLGLLFYVNGLRDFITFLFIIPIIRYFFDNEQRKEDFVKAFDRQLFLFLVVQFPCLLWQYLKYGANDHGGGSLGNWNSGVISTMIFMISFYLIQKRVDTKNYLKSLWDNMIYIILLFPAFLNETKISFIFLIMYFLLLLPIDKKIFSRILIMVPVIVLLMWLSIVTYINSTGGEMGDVFSVEYYIDGYLLNDESVDYAQWLFDADNGDTEDVPRFTKLLLLSDLHQENPGHVMTGFGVGVFKGGTIVDSIELFTEYEWLFVGSIPYLFHLLVQLGIVGVIWITGFWIIRFFPGGGTKRNMNIQLFMILLLLMLLFYNDTIRNPFMCFVLLYILESSFIHPKIHNEEGAECREENPANF